MQSTPSLIKILREAHPEFLFKVGNTFHWSPQEKTVFYADDDPAALLHELAHAILGHNHYLRDMELIEMERDAWAYATETLAQRYLIAIQDEMVQEALDSYRDWLHARSNCPQCGSTGIQSASFLYKCVACDTAWRVNEARQCALRRYTLERQKTPL